MHKSILKAPKLKKRAIYSYINSLVSAIIILSVISLFIISCRWILFFADWEVVTNNISTFAFGVYPVEARWRITLWFYLLSLLTIFTLFGYKSKLLKKLVIPSWFILIPMGLFLLAGGLGLTPVETRDWGGLALTFVLTIFSSILALPLGICLAIGRQSNIKIISDVSGIYIDLMRAFPLKTWKDSEKR